MCIEHQTESMDSKVKVLLSLPHSRAYNMLNECRSVDLFERVNRISEGAFGVVYKVNKSLTFSLQ